MEGRRERKKAQTRAALLRAAAALFSERGIYATRVADITDKIDLGKGAFYNYFESKDALVTELVAEGLRILEDKCQARLGDTGEAGERVQVIARLHAEYFDEHPSYALLLHQARGLLLLKSTRIERLREVFARYLERIGALLRPPGDPTEPDLEELLDLSAMIVGSAAGYSSFRLAAGLPTRAETPATTLAAGVPVLLASSRGDG